MEAPILRLASEGDAPALARIYAPSVAQTAISFEDVPPSPAEMIARIRATLSFAPWLVCESAGEVLGYAYASRHRQRESYRWSIDASVYVDARHRRRGVAAALYTSLFALARLQGFCAVHAGITLPNQSSVALHESFGFQPVGVYAAVGFKLGAWHDVGWWQLGLRDRTMPPPEPRIPAELGSQSAWAEALASGLARLQ